MSLDSPTAFRRGAVLLAVLCAGCEDQSASTAPIPASASSVPDRHFQTWQGISPIPPAYEIAGLPEAFEYEVVRDENLPLYTERKRKRVVDLVINEKLSEQQIEAFALAIRDSDPAEYARTTVRLALTTDTDGDAFWGIATLAPEPKIEILGVTIEREQELRNLPMPASGVVRGAWLSDAAFSGGRMVLYEVKGSTFLEHIHPDGSVVVREMACLPSDGGTLLLPVAGVNTSGDHWFITRDNLLELRSYNGLLSLGHPIAYRTEG